MDMVDDPNAEKYLNQIHQLYIHPELTRRKAEETLPQDFHIWQCLVRFTLDEQAIVEFNEEVSWIIPIPENTKSPERIAYVYMFWLYESYTEDYFTSPTITQKVPFGLSHSSKFVDAFGRAPSMMNIALTMLVADEKKEQLHKIGLWAVPALIPYPLSRIMEKIRSDELEKARAILVAHCTSNFIEQRLLNKKWKLITAFADRFGVFEEALFAHQNAKYASAIYTLIPQIEGVISDWLFGLMPEMSDQKMDLKSKIKNFHLLLKKIPDLGQHLEKTIESSVEFLKYGPPMQNFKNWIDKIDSSFPGRHAVAHGKYSNNQFTEENSIKLFLFLDTICIFMILYEASVLGRDFS